MEEKLQKFFKVMLTGILVFQLAGCGTLLYPERRGQVAGHLDAGVVILDAVGLLFFIIPGIIAFAVDFGNGCIYLPTRHVVTTTADLKVIRFDPKHTTLAEIEKIIKDQTGHTVKLAQNNSVRLKSPQDMVQHFAEAMPEVRTRLAFNK
jgi:hypothetical protein